MLRIVCIFYLLSLGNGLALVALDGMFPHVAAPARAAAEDPGIEIVSRPSLLERYSLPLLGTGVALLSLLQRWKGHS